MTYTADKYVAVLNTYSGHRALDDASEAASTTGFLGGSKAVLKRGVRKT